jgi:TonB family protein
MLLQMRRFFTLVLAATVCTTVLAESSAVPLELRPKEGCKPVYPDRSRRLGESGVVFVKMLVQVDGVPTQIHVAKSSGYTRLDQAAVEGASCFRFEPGSIRGVSSAMWFETSITFKLE